MTQSWPKDVINAIRRNDLVLVIGAGVSTNSCSADGSRPPSWSSLIRELSKEASGSTNVDENVEKLLQAGSLLEAAERVTTMAHMKGRIRDIQQKIRELTDGRNGSSAYMPNEWHDALMMLEPNVIITTNYDRLIERASLSGYQVHTYLSDTIGPEVRRGDPILVKIHGSVDDLNNIVLTQTDYSTMHVKGRHALEVVQALFLTRVILFVGYSLTDPDIRLLLQNTVGGRGQTPSHYLLTPELDDFQKQMLKDAFGVIPIEYSVAEDHTDGLAKLKDLASYPRNSPVQE
ncbi:SIR2 family protein [Rhodococcus sp. NPDC003348]